MNSNQTTFETIQNLHEESNFLFREAIRDTRLDNIIRERMEVIKNDFSNIEVYAKQNSFDVTQYIFQLVNAYDVSDNDVGELIKLSVIDKKLGDIFYSVIKQKRNMEEIEQRKKKNIQNIQNTVTDYVQSITTEEPLEVGGGGHIETQPRNLQNFYRDY